MECGVLDINNAITSNIYFSALIARLKSIWFVGIFAVMSCINVNAFAGSRLTISDEVFGNNLTTRAKANALDNAWGASFPMGAYRPNIFVGASGYTGSNSFTDPSGANYQINWQVGRINQVGPGLPASTDFILATSGSVTIGTSTSIQSSAPNPYGAETRLSTSVSGVGLKAVKLDFSSSPTDVYEFGIYVGDLESRPNNGTVGRVIVFGIAGIVIGDHPITYTGTIKTTGADTSYIVTEPTGAPTGAANNNNGDWGNGTTAFLSISSDIVIGSVIFHVGDDDHTNNNSGSTEQLGLAGFQVPASPVTPGSAKLTAVKTVSLFETGASAYALPGEDVVYSISVTNEGAGAADTNSIFLVDVLPDNLTFFNGDMDGAGPVIGAVKFTQSSANLSFDAATDARYSNASSAPASFAACSYSPIAGYDPAVKYICLNPKGAMASGLLGSPNPNFTLNFRAQIK